MCHPMRTKSIAQDTPRVSLRHGPGARPCKRPSTRLAGESPYDGTTAVDPPEAPKPRDRVVDFPGSRDRRPSASRRDTTGRSTGRVSENRSTPTASTVVGGDPGGPSGRPDTIQVGFVGTASPTRWYPPWCRDGVGGALLPDPFSARPPGLRDQPVGRVSSPPCGDLVRCRRPRPRRTGQRCSIVGPCKSAPDSVFETGVTRRGAGGPRRLYLSDFPWPRANDWLQETDAAGAGDRR